MKPTYLVVTSRNSWGKGVTEKEALSEAHKNRYSPTFSTNNKPYEVAIWRFPAQFVTGFGCNSMGGVEWDWVEGLTEKVKDFVRPSFHIGNYIRGARGALTPVERPED